MANLIRLPKCGSGWTQNDLRAYNIIVKEKSEKEFFGNTLSRLPIVSEDILTKELADKSMEENTYFLLRYLDMAMKTKEGEESAVDDFAVELLKILGYTNMNRMTRTRKNIRFFTCGEDSYAKTDVCLINEDEILLLIQTLKSPNDPEPQVIAEAIATFQHNNKIRSRIKLIEELDRCTIPFITMVGTFPTFYRMTITKELNECVHWGVYPSISTIVERHTPRVPRRVSDGMKPIENRKKILQCFEAFKKFVDA